MEMIQNILKKINSSKLWFSAAVIFISILNVSAVEARSLKKGEEFKGKDGEVIMVVSSDEVEIDDKRNPIVLGKYTVDGERVRVVMSPRGMSMVQYFKITPDGLVAEKGGEVFYTKAALAALNEKKLREAQAAAVEEITRFKMIREARVANMIRAEQKAAAKFAFVDDEVTDKKTGLIWRRCAEGMVYKSGTCVGETSKLNYEQALQHAAAQASNTGKAWRVPTQDELVGIIDISYDNPTINPTPFPATPPAGIFWSASRRGNDATFVDFRIGNVSSAFIFNGMYVRLVRTDEKAKRMDKAALTAEKFTINGDEVTGKETGLIWRRCVEGMEYRGGTCTGETSKLNYEQALQHAAAQASNTGKAWRVPTKNELVSIVDKSYSYPMIDHTAFPSTPATVFWSASPIVGEADRALVVFFNGGLVGNGNRFDNFSVRLVRAGQQGMGADENANTPPQSNAIATGQYANKGKVLEVLDASLYTFMQVTSVKDPIWIAASKISVSMGDTISYSNGKALTNFTSKSLNRTFDAIIFVDKIEVLK